MFKYNEDDILEILTEYLAEQNDFGTFGAKAILFVTENEDLRAVVVISEFEDDSIHRVGIEQKDKKIHFNGIH